MSVPVREVFWHLSVQGLVPLYPPGVTFGHDHYYDDDLKRIHHGPKAFFMPDTVGNP